MRAVNYVIEWPFIIIPIKYKSYVLVLEVELYCIKINRRRRLYFLYLDPFMIIFEYKMIKGKAIGIIVLIYCFILTSTSIIDTYQPQLQISVKGVSQGKVIFQEKINLIYSPNFFNEQKDRLTYPVTFPKQYASQMILQFSAAYEGKTIPNSIKKTKLTRMFFQYKQPSFIEQLLGKTQKYYPFFKDCEETYPENFHIKIGYNHSNPESPLPSPQSILLCHNQYVSSIQNYKSIENSKQNITINFIPSLRWIKYKWILDTLSLMKIANDVIENNWLITENRKNLKVINHLLSDYQRNIKDVQTINNALLNYFFIYFGSKILKQEENGYFQIAALDLYLIVMDKYKKLAFFDENNYYTIKYSIESITNVVNAILQIIFTYSVLSNLYQNYENHVGVSLIPAYLFTIQLIPSFLYQSNDLNYECIFYMIAIGIPCCQIFFGKGKTNILYKQKCKTNDNIFIFVLSFTLLLLLFGTLQMNKDDTQLNLLFILIIKIIGNYFMVISILSQIYQNYRMKSVRHLKKSYIAIVIAFALIDDLGLIIAESKVEVLSLLLADVLAVVLLLQLIKYNDLGQGTKQAAFKAYLQLEKQKRKNELKDIREKLKNA